MFYTIYQITNKVNQKIYVGAHKAISLENDYYWGSGSVLKKAIEKYGRENFEKEILHIVNTEQEMYDLEKSIVNEEFIQRSDTYNLKIGGDGGWKFQIDGENRHCQQCPVINQKTLNTKIERYGKPHNLDQSIKTIQSKYGVDHNLNIPGIREKMKQDLIDQYGVDNVSKRPDVIEKIRIKAIGNKHGNKPVVIGGIQYDSTNQAMEMLNITYNQVRDLTGRPRRIRKN
jgi:hypothetical protein